jgi:sortase A
VLAGHSGMSNARLFTDLSKLSEGDTFYIHVYNKTLTYTIDQIKTVLPTDTSDLTISPYKDYVTLVTCTPIGVNTHRLLVRGVRTE